MSKAKVVKIIVPIAIVLVIAGIFIFRSLQDAQQQEKIEMQAQTQEYPLHVNSVDIAELSEAGLPIIIDFGATECIPCIEMAPVLETLNEQMQGSAIIQFVDVWVNPEGATGFPVSIIPTQMIYDAQGKPYTPSEDLGIDFISYQDEATGEPLFTAHQGGLTEEQMRLILADMGVSNG